MSSNVQIEIPRVAGERAERHQARVLYLTMGADRNLRGVAQQLHKSVTLVGRWSVQDHWTEQAQRYDSDLALIAVARHRAEYDKALETHQATVMREMASLARILDGLEVQVIKALAGQVIIDKDGNPHVIPKMAIEISALATLIRGRMVKADMEAHALGIPLLRAALLEYCDDAERDPGSA